MRRLVQPVVVASVKSALLVYEALFGSTRIARDERRARVLGRRAAKTVWRLRRAYEEAAGDGQAIEALHDLRAVLPTGPEFRRAVAAWTDLLETVVQETEKRYGAKPGRGSFKAQQVRSVMVRLLIDQDLPTADVPAFLHPIVVETLVDFWIDSVVLVLNRHEIWDDPPNEGQGIGFVARVLQALRTAWRWLWQQPLMIRLSNWLRGLIRKAILSQHPLEPAVLKALERVRREGLINIDDLGRRFRALIVWIHRHRRRLIALIEIISIATEEAEVFQNMSGPQKKEYARALIKAFLEQHDLAPAEGTLAAVFTDYVIDAGVDSLVVLFHKRGVFPPHRRTAAA